MTDPANQLAPLGQVARFALVAIFLGICFAVAYKLLTRQISLRRLLSEKNVGAYAFSATRLQALLVTLAVAGMTLLRSLESSASNAHVLSIGFPASETALALGASHALYLYSKYRVASSTNTPPT